MDKDLELNIFSNSKRSRTKLSKKQFSQQGILAHQASSKKLASSLHRSPESSISLTKNLSQNEPKQTDTFANIMKGIMEMSNRIDDKYGLRSNNDNGGASGKSLSVSGKNVRNQNQKAKKGSKDRKSSWNMHRINQENYQDDQGENKKEDKEAQTSDRVIENLVYDTYQPMRYSSPQKSNYIIIPQNQRLVFPQPIVQVRPLSMPKQPLIQQNPNFPTHMSPKKVVNYQPIIRQTQHPPVPPTQICQFLPPRVVTYHHPPQIIQNQPHQQFKIVKKPTTVNLNRNYQRDSSPNNPYPLYEDYLTRMPSNAQPEVMEMRDKIPSQKKMSRGEIQKEAKKVGMTPEEYQKKMQQQYQLYNNQNAQLLKYMSQLTQQQKKQQLSQDLLQQLVKSSKSRKKSVKKVKKIIQKNIINTQNIQNVVNQASYHYQQHYQSVSALQMLQGVSIQGMIMNGQIKTIQNDGTFGAVGAIGNGNGNSNINSNSNVNVNVCSQENGNWTYNVYNQDNPVYQTKEGVVFRQLPDGTYQTKDGFVFKQLPDGSLQTSSGTDLKEHLKQVAQDLQALKKQQQIINKKVDFKPDQNEQTRLSEQEKVKSQQKKIKQLFETQKQKINQLNQKLEKDFDDIQMRNKINNYIADLDDLKQINKRDGQYILNQIDQILNKYSQKQKIQPQKPKQEEDNTMMSKFMSNVGNYFNKPDKTKVEVSEEPKINSQKEKSQTNSTFYSDNNFLETTKKFFSGLFGNNQN